MQGDLFRGDVSDGSRQLWSCVVAPVLLPSLSFSLSVPPLLFPFYFNSTTNCRINLSRVDVHQ